MQRQPKLLMPTLDWGHITPESFNTITNVCTHVYNHDLSSSEKADRTFRFILGRLSYYDLHLPENSTHSIVIDIRGQAIDDLACERLIEALTANYERPGSLSIDFKKQ